MEDRRLVKTEEIEEQSLRFFDLVINEKETAKSLAESYGLSLKTVYNRINRGREIVEQSIRDVGNKYLADIWLDYEKVKREAWKRFERTGDVNFMKEFRAVLEAQRKILSIDSPTKAPVNEEGKAVSDQLILVFDTKEYDVKEIDYKNQEVPGDYKLLDGSTEVPLTGDENGVESDVAPKTDN